MAQPQTTALYSVAWPHRYSTQSWTIGQRACLAISLEASARKLGNVHPQASFSNMCHEDFLRSAIAIAPHFDSPTVLTVGQLIYSAVSATRASVQVNTNLGTLLLIAPVAIATRSIPNGQRDGQTEAPQTPQITLPQLRERTAAVIDQLTADDSQAVYAAIRLAAPGGLGKTDKLDVHDQAAPADLIEAMRVVEPIDQIAKTYCSRFYFLFDEVVPALKLALQQAGDLEHSGDTHTGIRIFQLRWLARYGDSLVHRKLGEKENELLREKAAQLLQDLKQENHQWTDRFEEGWLALDHWMREDGHRRNPGTTADLIAAGLFVLLCCAP